MVSSSDADADLVSRARSGDRAALGTLWTMHHHMVLRFLRGLGCPSVDDVASMVWIDVARGIGRFDGDLGAFRRWLFTIARRRSIDDLRQRTRRADGSLGGEDGGVDQLLEWATADATRDPAEVHERSVALDRAIALVRTLPADQAEVVLLRIVADLDVAEVAEVTGKREGNVRVIMHRGLQRLAEQMSVTEQVPRTMKKVT
jgi:RNA polymerase sigma-70 factor (ECF subfamily)